MPLLVALAALGAVAAGLEIQRDRLVTDLRAIPLYADARLVREESGFKPTLAIATQTFVSLAESDLIADHYSDALQRAGWRLRDRTNRDGEVTLCSREHQTPRLSPCIPSEIRTIATRSRSTGTARVANPEAATFRRNAATANLA
jgi:hypothetical protein